MKNFSNKKINIIALILLLVFIAVFSFSDFFDARSVDAAWYTTGGTWGYRKQITVDPEKVVGSSNLTDFPMLFKVVDLDLRHTLHGGKMGKTDGTDMLFTSSDGSTKLSHEIESYSSTTGEIIAWVKVPTLYTAQQTVLYTYFGNSGASDQQDKTNVWDSNYKFVNHYTGTSTLISSDSTSNNHTITNSGASLGTGQIGGSADFESSESDYQTVTYTSALSPTQVSTFSIWVRKESEPVSGGAYIMELINNFFPSSVFFRLGCDGTSGNATKFGLSFYNGSFRTFCSSADIPVSTWTYLVATTNGTNGIVYINGVQDSSTAFTATPNANTVDNTIGQLGGGGRSYDGMMDEMRVSYGVARSGDWIATEYNNQSFPTSFYSYGAIGVENRSSSGVSTKGAAPASGSSVKVRGGVKFR